MGDDVIDRRDAMKALATAAAATWLPSGLARGFAAPGNPALPTTEQIYAVGELLPFAVWCEVSGLLLQVGKVMKAEAQADGSWWYDIALQTNRKVERIPEEIWNELAAQGSAVADSGEPIRFVSWRDTDDGKYNLAAP